MNHRQDECVGNTEKEMKYDENVIVECDGVISEILYTKFIELIGGSLSSVVAKNE